MAATGKSGQPDKFRKPFIVLTIALILIMLVYSLYYYAAGSKEMTYLADADTLAHTAIVLAQYKAAAESGKNIIWPAALQTFTETGQPDTNRSNVLHQNSVTRMGKISAGLEDEINEAIGQKSGNHPPVYLEKDEDTLRIYSYTFKKLNLPAVDIVEVNFGGKEVSALNVWAEEWQFAEIEGENVLRLAVSDGKEVLILRHSTLISDSIIKNAQWQKGSAPVLIKLPVMDFMLREEIQLSTQYPEFETAANRATQVVKFMIAPKAVDKKVHKQISDETKTITYNRPFTLTLHDAENLRPYLLIRIENTELLRK